MTQPIKPKDVVSAKQESLPDEVIEAFNELIAENWKNLSSVVKQKEVIERIREKLGWDNEKKEQILANNWLDVEDVYRKAGWKVEYDSPGFNESAFDANFKFSKERKK